MYNQLKSLLALGTSAVHPAHAERVGEEKGLRPRCHELGSNSQHWEQFQSGSITFCPPLPIFRAEQIQQRQSFLTRFTRVPSPTSLTHPNFACRTDFAETKMGDSSVLIPFKEALLRLENRRVRATRPLIPPQILQEELPLTLGGAQTVIEGRKAVENILRGNDDRLVVVVGPCSVNNVESALEYASHLQAYAQEARDDLHIIMRVYFEKPRTTVGWKGFINDPDMNSSFQINKGLRIARTLLLDIAKLGLPAGCEFLDTISPQYTADLVSWGAIGARTTESQVHRELTSGLSMPTGFKNSTDGSVGIAVDACRAARTPHVFLSVGKEGLSSIIETEGNPDVHVILRGGVKGPNYAAEFVKDCGEKLKKADLPQKVMIDCSHGNSQKQYKKQLEVVNDIVKQLSSPETGTLIMGVMLESNLVEGRQEIPASGPAGLRYGQSVTDACISWEQTVPALDALRGGVRGRRDTVYRLARGLSLDA